jgi:hypothetical protein
MLEIIHMEAKQNIWSHNVIILNDSREKYTNYKILNLIIKLHDWNIQILIKIENI